MKAGTYFTEIYVKKPGSDELVKLQDLPQDEYELFLYGMSMLHKSHWERKKVFVDQNQFDSEQTVNQVILTSNAAQ